MSSIRIPTVFDNIVNQVRLFCHTVNLVHMSKQVFHQAE